MTTPLVIEVQVEKIGQLFHTLDPMPFRDRDLDREAEDYIVSWARELPRKHPLRILVHMPASEAAGEQAGQLEQALHRYFAYRADTMTGELKELFRIGRYSLLIGIVVLGACLTLGHFLTGYFTAGDLGRYLNEGLIILGWVANWKPIEIFFYDWWPILRRRALFRRLAVAEVVLSSR
ncbi:MAG: hypothetical protein RL274_1616 [Pseudomonadota bacterium]|jgi:hypothetical protein